MRRACLAGAGVVLALLTGCSAAPQSAPPLMPAVQAPAQIAAAPPPPPPAAPPALPVLAGHVASYKSLSEAEAAWPRLAERFPLLKEQPRQLVEIDLGGQRGKVVRLLIGGFADPAQASQFCHRLRASGAYCAPHELPANTSAKAAS